MTYTIHPARYVGRCSACDDTIIRGDTVMTIHAGTRRRTVCRPCGRLYQDRQARAGIAASDATAAALRAPDD